MRQEFPHLMRWRRRPLPKPQVLSGASGLQTCECLSVSMSVCHNASDVVQTVAWAAHTKQKAETNVNETTKWFI